MPRVAGWEKALNAVIIKHRKLPSEYGVSDCYMIADDAVLAVTGERMFPDVQYSSEIGAAKALLAHGFDNVEQAFASKFEAIPPSMAQRGDIGVILNGNELCGGFFSSMGFVARDLTSLIYLPVSQVQTAFKVGR